MRPETDVLGIDMKYALLGESQFQISQGGASDEYILDVEGPAAMGDLSEIIGDGGFIDLD